MARQRALKKRKDYRGGGYVGKRKPFVSGAQAQANAASFQASGMSVAEWAKLAQEEKDKFKVGSAAEEQARLNAKFDVAGTTGSTDATGSVITNQTSTPSTTGSTDETGTPDTGTPVEAQGTSTTVTREGTPEQSVIKTATARPDISIDVDKLDVEEGISADEDIQQITERGPLQRPDDVVATTIDTTEAQAAQAAQQAPVTAADYDAVLAGDLAPTQAAQGQVTREGEAAEAQLTTTEAATRDAQQEAAAQAEAVDFSEDIRSQIDRVTGEQVQVTTTADAEKQQREAITGIPADDGVAAEIIALAGYEAAQQRQVTGQAATAAAETMIAETGDLPPDVAAAIVEDSASVEAQMDNQPVEVQAAVAALPTEALVSSQIETLLAGMDEGQTPAWARPAVTAVNQQMAERGLSVSSVGRDALFNAIIQSAMPMAQSNAQALQQRAAQNLSNEQQANLAQATQDMQRRMANLANRQTAESQSAANAQQMATLQSQFRQDATMLSANQQQQTSLQNLQNLQQSATLNLQSRQAMAAQNLGNEQQIEMANLQIDAQRAGADQAAENQARLAEFQVASDFMAKNAAFTQDMRKANLSNDQQMRLANLSALNQAASEQLTVDQQTELANLNKTLETNKLQANIAQQMGLAQLNVDQQTAVQNAARVANIDLTKFNAAQQVELTNSKFMQTMTVSDFNAEQQAIMQDATTLAAMDMQTADAKTKVRIQNAQNFLQMDMANLNNKQQASVLDQQLQQQRLLSDQAATNAASQFNATSENQTNQFMASLGQQLEQFNAQQANAMTQFNSSEANKVSAINAGNTLEASRFNNQLAVQIEQYDRELEFRTNSWNATNAQAVEQSNVTWRRKANTLETAANNAANQQAAQFAFNLSASEQNFVWQSLRDNAAFNQQTSQNKAERAMQILSAIYGNTELMKKKERAIVQPLADSLEFIIFGQNI
tara:strand:+ start:1978 stop:4830 length:2853 start_codon:yes stop_codon:yes gene_type:complete